LFFPDFFELAILPFFVALIEKGGPLWHGKAPTKIRKTKPETPLEVTDFALGIEFDESLFPVSAVSVLSTPVSRSLALSVLRADFLHLHVEEELYRLLDLLLVRQLVNFKIVRILMFRTTVTLFRYYRTQNDLVRFQLQINFGFVCLSGHDIFPCFSMSFPRKRESRR
jgi:hypothetical protein